MSKPRRIPNKCMFHPNADASRRGEHLWSDWMKGYFESPPVNHKPLRLKIQRDQLIVDPLKARSGAPHTMTVPYVCEHCNNGWMSRLEAAVIPVLKPILEGESISLSESDRSSLGRWMMMKTIVGEWDVPANVALKQADRDAFYKNCTYPANAQIYLARSTAKEWQTHFFHFGVGRYSSQLSMLMPPDGLGHNAQATTLCINGIVLHCRTSVMPNWANGITEVEPKMIKLYPRAEGVIDWPILFDLTAVEMFKLATADMHSQVMAG